jgi:hypothetical protein
VAGLGVLLGGEGWDFVFAFALLAVVQWAAAMITAVHFARIFGGDVAGLVAAALLSGGIWSAGPFLVGVPSGWIFILTPWAIELFLRDRTLPAALVTSAVMYVHLGGAPVAPFGVFLAALFTRRWLGLAKVAGLTAVITSPYLIHFVRHLDWYTGQRGFVAGSANWLLYALAVPGLVWLLFRPRAGLFLLVWAAAPLAWVFQDALRFVLQSSVAGACIGGVLVAWLLHRYRVRRAAVVTVVVALATVFPLSIPSLPVELAWASGRGFPRELDWLEAEALAQVVADEGLSGRIFSPYYDSLCGAMSVFTPVRQQRGHWGEVRPPVDPAIDVSARAKAYLLPVPPGDRVLARLERQGLIRVHGGGSETSVVTLGRVPPLQVAAALAAGIVREEALWLADNAVPNTFPDVRDLVLSDEAIPARRRAMAAQKTRAGRIQVAVLVYATAVEPVDPGIASGVRESARGWGSIANFIGDETAIDYIDDARFQRFRTHLRTFAEEIGSLGGSFLPTPELDEATDRLFDDFFGS